MKTLRAVIFLALLGVSLCLKLTEDMLMPEAKECLKELGIEMQEVMESTDENSLTTEGNPNINNLIVCLYKKLNIVDENNEVNYEALKPYSASFIAWLNTDIVDKEQAANDAIEACKGVKGNGLGDYLVKLSNCVVNKTKKI